MPLEAMWKITTSELYLLTLTHDVEIHSFVLMPNHFHLLITVPKADLGKIMNLYMAAVTKTVNLRTGRSGRVFGGPYYWSIITCTRYYGHAFKYLYRNPVRAGICIRVEQYRFSTIQGLMGIAPAPLPLSYTRLGLELNLPEHENCSSWLEWLNTPFPQEAEKLIKKALSRRELKPIIERSKRKPVDQLAHFL